MQVVAKKRKPHPIKVDEKKAREIIDATAKGLTKTEVCAYVGISPEAYKTAMERIPDLAKTVEAVKSMPNIKARLNVYEALKEGDLNTSKWYLERKAPDYSNKTNVTIESEISIEDRESAIDKLLEAFTKK